MPAMVQTMVVAVEVVMEAGVGAGGEAIMGEVVVMGTMVVAGYRAAGRGLRMGTMTNPMGRGEEEEGGAEAVVDSSETCTIAIKLAS